MIGTGNANGETNGHGGTFSRLDLLHARPADAEIVPLPPAVPSKRRLKAALLWCARRLVGDGAPYPGRVVVTVTAAAEGESVTVEPVPGMDGTADPGTLAPAAAGPAAAELLRVLFSQDERLILRALVADQPCKAATVMQRSGIKESKFWVLWSNLQQRGVVDDADDDSGFVVRGPWVAGVVAG